MSHRTKEELEQGLASVLEAPAHTGRLELIVRRPEENKREVVASAELSVEHGLEGDLWKQRRPRDLDMQIALMSSRVAALIAGEREHWPLAGDQLFVELNLSSDNLPPGTRLSLGEVLLEVTAEPHTGCKKFVRRFGMDAMHFVNSARGRLHNLRGLYAKVLEPGSVREGATITVLRP